MGRSPLGDRKNKPQVEFAKKWEGRTGTIFFFFSFSFFEEGCGSQVVLIC